jgi:hypothetical protein
MEGVIVNVAVAVRVGEGVRVEVGKEACLSAWLTKNNPAQ